MPLLIGFILAAFNAIVTMFLFFYMLTHAIDQTNPVYWVAVITVSVASVIAFAVTKNWKWQTLFLCNAPLLTFLFLFLLPVNLNREFFVGMCVPYLALIVGQIVICKLAWGRRRPRPEESA